MRNKKKLVIIVMLVAVALMSMGYALFATQLNINSIGNITSTWNVYFESISSGTKVGGATNASTPSVSGTSANMNVNLDLPGDSMTYSLVLKNGGTVGAIIEDIDAVATGSGAIIYSISGLKIGDKLAAGASKTITIKIEYDPNTSSQPSETYKKLTVTIDAVQDIGQTITNQTPSVEQPMLLGTRILNDNVLGNNENLDFIEGSTDLLHKENMSTTTSTIQFDSNTKYVFGSFYYFDDVTGLYSLTNSIRTSTWTNMSTIYSQYPYTCLSTSNDGCQTLYKMVSYTDSSSGAGYIYDSIKNVESTQKGLYSAPDDYGTSYYFRGNVDNNYVKFGTYAKDTTIQSYNFETYMSSNVTVSAGTPMYWRIIRINGDGSIRMMYVGTEPYENGTTKTNRAIPATEFNSSNYSSSLEKHYTYQENGVQKDSTVKQVLENWYANNLDTISKSQVVDRNFCNDTQVVKSDSYYTYYGATQRLEAGTPKLTCSQSSDIYTVSNGKLSQPVGLITADEVMMAGASVENGKGIHYLTVYQGYAWTMSPNQRSNYGELKIWSMEGTGLDNYSCEYDFSCGSMMGGSYANPVINLKADVAVTGSGTINDPYVVQVN